MKIEVYQNKELIASYSDVYKIEEYYGGVVLYYHYYSFGIRYHDKVTIDKSFELNIIPQTYKMNWRIEHTHNGFEVICSNCGNSIFMKTIDSLPDYCYECGYEKE